MGIDEFAGSEFVPPEAAPQGRIPGMGCATHVGPRSGPEQPAIAVKGLERVMGIEPTLAAWEAAVLPLNYTRMSRAAPV
jgi:hypothetical protein